MEPVPVPRFDELPLLGMPAIGARYRTHHEQRRMLRACLRDGIPLGQHAACCDCGALAGPQHPVARALIDGRCAECRA